MNLDRLEMFVTTINCGSMKIASERFFMSQSALSQNIKKLESELGCPLIDRSHSPLKPTTYGRIVLDRAERMLYLAHDITEEIARKKAQDASILRIGCFYPMLAYSEMAHVASAHTDIKFNVVITSEKRILDDLVKGKYDIALLSDRNALPGFRKVELGREYLYVSVPCDSPLASGDVLKCKDLHETEIVVPNDLEGVSAWYQEVLQQLEVEAERVIRLPSDEYFSALNDPSVNHFRSSLMTAPLHVLSCKKHLKLTDPEIARTIIALYPISKAKKLEPIIDTLSAGRGDIVSAIAVLPELLHLGSSPNLKIEDCSSHKTDK